MGSARSLLALLAAVVILGAIAAGCGDGSGASSAGESPTSSSGSAGADVADSTDSASADPEYEAILVGLRKAAESGSAYGAERRAQTLPPAEQAAVEAFCYFAWQIGVNREGSKLDQHPYVVGRVTQSAEWKFEDPEAIGVAMEQLQQAIDLGALDAGLVGRYSKACEK